MAGVMTSAGWRKASRRPPRIVSSVPLGSHDGFAFFPDTIKLHESCECSACVIWFPVEYSQLHGSTAHGLWDTLLRSQGTGWGGFLGGLEDELGWIGNWGWFQKPPHSGLQGL